MRGTLLAASAVAAAATMWACGSFGECAGGPEACTRGPTRPPSVEALVGAWVGRTACVDTLDLGADGGFSWRWGAGCPRGGRCVWEGYVTNEGSWSLVGGDVVALSFSEPPDTRGGFAAPRPATLAFSDACGGSVLTYTRADGGLAGLGLRR